MNLVQVVCVNEYGEDVEIFFQTDPTLNGPLPITSLLPEFWISFSRDKFN